MSQHDAFSWRGGPHNVGTTICVAAVCVLGYSFSAGSAMTAGAPSEGERFLAASFFARQEEPLRSYRAFRRMHAWSEKFNQEGWLDAWTELKDGRLQYQVVTERGSDTIRNRVLRAILKREQELVASGDTDRADLTPENYDFSEAGRDSDGTHLVQITPRRKDVLLVEGRMVLSPDGRDLLRVEGRLSKNPSFWTSLVNVVRHYARLAGVRVPVATESTAKVKFAGNAQLEVAYEYETVNGQNVALSAQRRAAPSRSAAR
jgi:hypothetical protein